MELSKKGLIELKDVLTCYQDKVFDLSAMEKILAILNREELIYEQLEYEFDSEFDACTDMNTGILYFNEDLLLRSSSSMYDQYIPNELKIEATNLNMLAVFIHECTHLEQYLYLTKLLDTNDEITRLYDNLYKKSNQARFKLLYKFFSIKFSFERNANLAGFYNVEKLAGEELKKFFQTYYIYTFLEGYETKRGKTTNPVDITYKMIGIKDKVDTTKFSLKEKLLHGVKLTDIEYNDIIRPYDDSELKSIEYEPLIKKIYK